jgi:type I restriction enzyme S subunit
MAPGPGVIVGRKGTAGSVHWSPGPFYPIDTTYFVRLKEEQTSLAYAYFKLLNLGLHRMNQDSAVPGLNRAQALAVPVRMPPAEVLADFTERVRPLFALRDQLAAEKVSVTGLRDYLLPRLISGKVLVGPRLRKVLVGPR